MSAPAEQQLQQPTVDKVDKADKKDKKEKKEKKAAKAKNIVVPVANSTKDNVNANGITVSKDANFSQWYQEVVTKGELIEYYKEVLRPRRQLPPNSDR